MAKKERLEPRKSPVQKRSKNTVEIILAAAAQVFEAHGYAAGTTNRIAKKAGVSIGTLYQYFPSKEAVAVALLEKHISDTERHLYEWVGHMVGEHHVLKEALYDYVAGMLDVHWAGPRLQHILLEETPLPPRVHETLQNAERNAAKTFAGLLKTYSSIKRKNLDEAGFIIVQTVESLTHRFAAHPDEQFISRIGFIEEVVDMLLAYLTC